MKVLITGGSGFIGTNLIEFYKEKNEVLNIDFEPPRNSNHKKYWKNVNILDFDLLHKTVIDFKPDYVFHMAARTDLDGKTLEDYNANIAGVENILKVVKLTPSIKKIIFASSRLVCKIGYEPKNEFDYKATTLYGESKILGEQLVRNFKLPHNNWVIVRPTSLWGPWFRIPYKTFFDTVQKKLYFHPQGKKIYKKFGFVLNSVFILDTLLHENSLNTKTVYLSDFEELEVKNWADIISNHFHNQKVRQIPFFILKTIAISGDFLKLCGLKNPPLTSFRLNNLITPMHYDTTNVQNIVKELPFNLEKATEITYKWLKEKENIKI